MVKKKQKPSPETAEPVEEKEKEEHVVTLEEVLLKIKANLEMLADGQNTLNQNQQSIEKRMDNYDRRLNAIAKTATENPKQEQEGKLDPMTIFKTITDLLNSPIVNKLADKFFSGTEETPPTTETQIPPEDYKAYVDFRKGTMENLLATQKEQLEALRLTNLAKKKELESDLS